MTKASRPTPISATTASIIRSMAVRVALALSLALPMPALAAGLVPPPPPPPAPKSRAAVDVASLPASRAVQAQTPRQTVATTATTSGRAAANRNARRPAQPAVAAVGRIPCVQFVRATTDFRLSGNAHLWWSRAAGVHARGSVPEVGSILSFKSIKSMPLGHVAVVSRVISSREIEIDHSNWVNRGVIRGAEVVDVSPRNDWTAVRVSLKPGAAAYGSIYPTNGFIYARPHGSDVETLAERPVDLGLPRMGPPPRDLRPNAERSRAPG
jgi:hypothetical protein